MEFKAKNLEISTGDALIVILNEMDANKYALSRLDRISVKNGSEQKIVAVLDITNSKELVPYGSIGLFDEVKKAIGAKNGHKIEINLEKKPDSIAIIKKKMDKQRLEYDEFKKIMEDIILNKLTSVELTYFIAGCYMNELSTDETLSLTKAMISTGDVLHFHERIVMDKHCIGGVAANRTTPLIVSIIAAAGHIIPKTSSRSITSAAGTADTIECLCNVNLTSDELKQVVKKTNACLAWGGSLNLAPADDKIIRVESPISLDPTGQLIASVLAKKKSVSANRVLIDIPVGRGAKIEDKKNAKILKKKFKKIGRKLKMRIKVLMTDGSHPIGNGIGPMLEARDILWTLKNDMKGSFDLKEKSIKMAGELLNMSGFFGGEKKARKIFDSGRAYSKFIEIIKAQGGKEIDPDTISLAKYSFDVYSQKNGRITHVDNKIMNRIARVAGAPIDKRAGVYLYISKGRKVNYGERLFTIYAECKEKLEFSKEVAEKTLGIEIE
jgi:AMP phosphorylase